jgi:hypothetical protein
MIWQHTAACTSAAYAHAWRAANCAAAALQLSQMCMRSLVSYRAQMLMATVSYMLLYTHCTALHACAQQGAAAAVSSAAQFTLVEAPAAAVNSASSSIKSAVSSATNSVRTTVSNASNSAVKQVILHIILYTSIDVCIVSVMHT